MRPATKPLGGEDLGVAILMTLTRRTGDAETDFPVAHDLPVDLPFAPAFRHEEQLKARSKAVDAPHGHQAIHLSRALRRTRSPILQNSKRTLPASGSLKAPTMLPSSPCRRDYERSRYLEVEMQLQRRVGIELVARGSTPAVELRAITTTIARIEIAEQAGFDRLAGASAIRRRGHGLAFFERLHRPAA